MNLLNDCSEEATEEKCPGAEANSRKLTSSNLSALRNCTVLAMSNLLNANIDSGLMHSIGNDSFFLSMFCIQSMFQQLSFVRSAECAKDLALFACYCLLFVILQRNLSKIKL